MFKYIKYQPQLTSMRQTFIKLLIIINVRIQ